MKTVSAQVVFFPAACFYGALAVVLSAVALNTGWPMGLVGSGHGHELLFGFLLALVAGYNLGKLARFSMWCLFILWLLARITYIIVPTHPVSQWLSPIFALVLAWKIVPRFFAAKKWRNKMISPLLLVICIFPLLWYLQFWGYIDLSHRQLLSAILLLFILLMAFFGGRIIAPAAAGELQKQGKRLQAPVQARLEGLLLLLLPVGALSISVPSTDKVAGVVTLLAASILLIRLTRWQLWHCLNRPDLMALGMGYFSLALGTLALGVAFWFNLPIKTILHIVTVAAAGCLSAGVILKSQYKRETAQTASAIMVLGIISLICIAASMRVLATVGGYSLPLLSISALCWAIAFLCLGVFLLKNSLGPFTISSWRQAT
ncbi:NnrS family protein [Kangiella sediminilitoris]|uniref:NnrS family protein n=1 Tax=Kangiella sediminilitoris TaxID=1144748 RepID=A0A1B3B8X6_9GAMM|nr:NnrS family protein [Kangiella sediminilitoris]AOE49252.1 NnrS family protein [Kangiella sediminilitoris]